MKPPRLSKVTKFLLILGAKIRSPRILGFIFLRNIYTKDPDGCIRRYIPEHTSKDRILLALSYHLFRGDIEILNKETIFTVIFVPFEFQTMLLRCFYTENFDLTEIHAPPKSSKVEYERDKLRVFLNRLIRLLSARLNVEAVISANFKLKEDIDISVSFSKLNIPYIVLHRENFIGCKTSRDFVIERTKRTGKFKGDLIIVHNKMMKDLLTEMNYCSESQIIIAGALRMGGYVSSKLQAIPNSKVRNKILCFALRNGSGWPQGGHFNMTYETLFDYVEQNKDTELVIKFKDSDLLGTLGSNFYNSFDIRVKNLYPRVRVTGDGDIKELILSSDLIIGIHTTAILEAGYLEKKVLVPFYERFKRNQTYFDGINLAYKLDNLYYVAKDEEHFYQLINQLLEEKSCNPSKVKLAKKEFLHWTYPLGVDKATQTYENLILEAITRKTN